MQHGTLWCFASTPCWVRASLSRAHPPYIRPALKAYLEAAHDPTHHRHPTAPAR
jgi:hypothetical protein